MNDAIFLDRDGVINHPVLDPKTGEYAAPWNPDDFVLCDGVIESLRVLLNLDYKLFIVSNQPDYAKGKTTLENLKLVHNRMHSVFVKNNITFGDYYYCYHHPKGRIPEYTKICECRKPGNYFLKQAQIKYSVDLTNSWMIGDRDTDIYCGQSVGAKTIMIRGEDKASQSRPDFKANSLKEAVEIIENEGAKER